MDATAILPRLVRPRLDAALVDSPVVIIHGPRQCGKTTLAKEVGEERGYEFFTLDDEVVRAAAEEDPARFIGDLPPRAIIDEVQRTPRLFTAIKSSVDANRIAGWFLLSSRVIIVRVTEKRARSAGAAGR